MCISQHIILSRKTKMEIAGSKMVVKIWRMVKKMKCYFGVVFLQIAYAVMNTIAAVSLKRGLSHFVFSVYRHAIATLFLAPFALLLERKTRPPMTLPIFLRILMLALLEPIVNQNLYYTGMKYTSATLASSIGNVIPTITFIMAVIFRLESINLKEKHSLAKIIGTVITVAGAMVMSLYKGPAFDFLSCGGGRRSNMTTMESADHHWVTGTIFLLLGGCACSAFYILQSVTLKMYPAKLSLAALICMTGMLGGGVLTLAVERNMMVWVLGWDSRLLAVLYTGIVCSGIGFYVQGVVMKERGPVFMTSFGPLCTVITTLLSSIFLADKLHLGSVIGTVIVVLGLYTLIWGKSKDFEISKLSSNHIHQLPVIDSTFRPSTAAHHSNAGPIAGTTAEASIP